MKPTIMTLNGKKAIPIDPEYANWCDVLSSAELYFVVNDFNLYVEGVDLYYKSLQRYNDLLVRLENFLNIPDDKRYIFKGNRDDFKLTTENLYELKFQWAKPQMALTYMKPRVKYVKNYYTNYMRSLQTDLEIEIRSLARNYGYDKLKLEDPELAHDVERCSSLYSLKSRRGDSDADDYMFDPDEWSDSDSD